ncbi:MAG: hypothetical protein HY645_11980 [Acidobacteria bacterium]|nr:hypothetical protein [Acidobacteriota bacterium]
MQELVELQKSIWGYGTPQGDLPYPARALFALAESGGHVGAAKCGEQIVGFSVAWLGRDFNSGEEYLHSQLVGVLPSFRHAGLGYRLKLQQRDYALQHNLKLIRWTFDPMQSANANLNLRKLSTVVARFLPHYYDSLQSHFSRGLATDRVRADWYIQSPRVIARLAGSSGEASLPSGAQIVTVTRDEEFGGPQLRRLLRYFIGFTNRQLLVEIPVSFVDLCAQDIDTAREWQEQIRYVLEYYLDQGYLITDFVVLDSPPRAYYLLTRDSLQQILDIA